MSADQRNLGMSMKVEKSTLDQVKKRFEFNKKAKEQKEKEYGVSFLVLVHMSHCTGQSKALSIMTA